MKRVFYLSILLFLAGMAACNHKANSSAEEQVAEPQHTILYGIIADNYRTESGTIGKGETLGKILGRYGISATTVDKLDKAAKDIFPLRQIRADKPYTVFLTTDSIAGSKLDYFVYEKDLSEYEVFGFKNDSITITEGHKGVKIRRKRRS